MRVMSVARTLLGVVLTAHTASALAHAKPPKPEFSRVKLTKVMRNLDKENFDTIYKWENFLENEAGSGTLLKTLKRLKHKAKSYGIELKPDFCGNAKATEKRRVQQKAYEIQKEENRSGQRRNQA